MANIDWHSPASSILINPRFSQPEQNKARHILERFSSIQGHFWFPTSGSTGKSKWTALSKVAILHSAKAVNQHLGASSKDIWINPLPLFHVGGMGIVARAYLTSSNVYYCSWDPLNYQAMGKEVAATLSSLVPTQVFDLVALNAQAPPSLRAVIVGGGALSQEIYEKAVQLGWPLLPSYGLTECASQVATATIGSGNAISNGLPLLSHVEVDVNREGLISIKSESLLTGYAIEKGNRWEFLDPKVKGWFQTEDYGLLNQGRLTVKGRNSHFVKIGGESVDLLKLEKILEEVRLAVKEKQDVALTAIPDERLGHIVTLVSTGEVTALVNEFNNRVAPYERIRVVHYVEAISRTALGKAKATNS